MKKEDFLVEKYGKKNVGMDDLKKEDKQKYGNAKILSER